MRMPRHAATAAVAVAAVADVALIALLLRPAPVTSLAQPVSAAPTARPVSASASASPSPPATVARSPSSTSARSSGAASARALPVDAGSGGFVLRADPGSCVAGGAALRFSATDGARWVDLKLPPTVRRIVRVAIDSPTSLWFVGAGPDCVPHFWRSTDAGASWSGPADTRGAWFAPLAGGIGVHGPTVTSAAVCSGSRLVSLAPSGASAAAAACANGAVAWTHDGGRTWTSGEALPGVLAMALWTPSAGLASVAEPGCPGVAVTTTSDGGGSWSTPVCVDGVSRSLPLGVAVAGLSVSVLVSGTGPNVAVWLSPAHGTGWFPVR